LDPDERRDVSDLALLWAELGVRRAPRDQAGPARQEALELLAEAQASLGASPALDRARRLLAGEPGLKSPPPRTAWEHYVLGRSLLGAGRLTEARQELGRALAERPNDFWSNFSCGVCCYRMHQQADALVYFHACVVLAPDSAECYYNRALAHQALGNREAALRDYDRALQLASGLAGAAFNRGLLHLEGRNYAAAIADLENALAHGADPAPTLGRLAQAQLARGDRAAARAALDLANDPGQRDGAELCRRLRAAAGPPRRGPGAGGPPRP
jgi:tetratricopeptide (TPR) repeat protein